MKPTNCPQNIWDRYQIYTAYAADLGWKVKALEEWLSS